jgi:hypothetical protein
MNILFIIDPYSYLLDSQYGGKQPGEYPAEAPWQNRITPLRRSGDKLCFSIREPAQNPPGEWKKIPEV